MEHRKPFKIRITLLSGEVVFKGTVATTWWEAETFFYDRMQDRQPNRAMYNAIGKKVGRKQLC